MQPQAPTQQQQPMAFTDSHNSVYNNLRDMLQRHVAAGVPGMDKVVDALNKQHQAGMQTYTPAKPRPMVVTQVPEDGGVQQSPVGQLSNLMTAIRQQNSPALPNGYSAYSG